ncbi:MAG: T9SS type A sorting domain-containing protein [Cryomorphaceae bacterium]|nr:T9SS type A sorting domain-containing protein [Flavobacteriales bacterium]
MKKLYTFIAAGLLLTALNVSGQITIEPNPVYKNDFPQSETDVVAYSHITNEAEFSRTYTWTRNVIEITEGWTSAVCDTNQCYLTFVSTQEFTLPAGATGNLDVHVYPDGIEGAAIIEVYVEDNGDESNNATGVYLFNQPLSTPERLSERIKVFPNPTVDFLNIENPGEVNRLEFYSIEGRLIKSVQTNGNAQIAVGDLASGNYILRMWDRDNNQVSSNLLMKD